MTICFRKNNETGFTFCVYDTIVYDHSGQVVSMKTVDNKGNYYPPVFSTSFSKHEIVINSNPEDSSTSYQSYNEKGQLVAVRRIYKGMELENTRFYYNRDGLLDSTFNTHWGIFVFRRRRKGKEKWIEMENTSWHYRWVYNNTGQCIGHVVIPKIRSGVSGSMGYNERPKLEVSFSYNTDGTLSKVETKRSDMPVFAIHYSYVK